MFYLPLFNPITLAKEARMNESGLIYEYLFAVDRYGFNEGKNQYTFKYSSQRGALLPRTFSFDVYVHAPIGSAYLDGEMFDQNGVFVTYLRSVSSNKYCSGKGIPSLLFKQLNALIFQIAEEEHYDKDKVRIQGWLSMGEVQNWTSSIPFYIKAACNTFDFSIYDKETGEKELFIPATMNLSHDERNSLAKNFQREYGNRDHTFLFAVRLN